ncbi:MAG TPA: 50S ribosomal protein L22 [Fibrobacteraceae bacterium]|nr:50S ribosomal protein L22 [Fibrobacteraceae bacterium]
MEAVAKVRYIRYGQLKLRQVADLVRGKSVDQALAILSLLRSRKKGAGIVENAVKSAVANLKNSDVGAGIQKDSLSIKQIHVSGGPIMKRIRPRSQGRAFRIEKPMSHLTVVVSD